MKSVVFVVLACLYPQLCFADPMVLVPTGRYVPFFIEKPAKVAGPLKRDPVEVKSFWMDRYPVTNGEFLRFLEKKPKWRKSKVKRLFADAHYLEGWGSDLSVPQGSRVPVTQVSWFAAAAYCHDRGKELPTTDQWEYAAGDDGRGSAGVKARVLEWYSKPNSKSLSVVGRQAKNGFGVYDLHGLIWEWTLDFNSALVGDESRDGGTPDQNLFCGSGSQGALDSTDYASFMRFSFRSSLKANFAVSNLGFRCVKGAL